MEYDLVFDAAQGGFRNWWFAAAGLLFVLIGAVLVKHRRKLPPVGGMGPTSGQVFSYLFLLFSVLWTTLAFTATGLDYLTVRSAVRNGDTEVVEGRVEDFIPMPYEGHARERFSVCGRAVCPRR